MTAPKLPEGFQALRDATAAVLAPIGNMTDRHTAVLRTMERRLAFQQACGPYTIDALLRALSDAQAALQALAADTARLAFLTDPKALRFVEECAGLYRVYEDKAPAAAVQHLWQSVTTLYYPSAAEAIDAAIDSALLAAKEAK